MDTHMNETILSNGLLVEREAPESEFAGLTNSEMALKYIKKLLADAERGDSSKARAAIGWLTVCEPVERALAEREISKATGITLAAVREQLKTELPAAEDMHKKRAKAPAEAPSPRGVHLSEQGNGERFAQAFGDRFRWSAPWDKWLAWDGRRWAIDAVLDAERAGLELPKLIGREAEEEVDEARRKALRRWASSTERRAVIRASLELAKPLLAVTPEQLDTNGWLLNVRNGTLDLQTGELKPHDRADLITKLAPVDYHRDAVCPRWEQFLLEVFADDLGLIGFVQRFIGMSLTADVSEHIFPVLWGAGRNGKSVLVDTILGILGDYACPAPPSLLTVRHNEEHPTEIAGLRSMRLVIGSESEQGARLRVQLVKSMTGDAVLRGRLMYHDYFNFLRTFKLALVTNHRPRIADDSDAAWERVKLVPFTAQFKEGTARPPDKHLLEKLKAEWSGILAWAVEGNLARLRNGGLTAPKTMTAATASVRRDEGLLAGFLGDAVVLDPEAWTPVAQLREALEQAGDLKWGRMVTERLKEVGCHSEARRVEGKLTRGWSGIGLKM